MRCLHPIDLTRTDKSVYTVPCGRCEACRINRATMWSVRIYHEARCHDVNHFITLTYARHAVPAGYSLCKRDLQLYFKRLRKIASFRYFACGEYGETKNRPHYHAILFGLSLRDKELKKKLGNRRCWYGCLLRSVWQFKGIVHIGNVSIRSAQYVAGYVNKKMKGGYNENRKRESEFQLCSRRPGIASDFAKKYIEDWLRLGAIRVEGKKRVIPRYYFSKISEERYREYVTKRAWDSLITDLQKDKFPENPRNESSDQRRSRKIDILKMQEVKNTNKL